MKEQDNNIDNLMPIHSLLYHRHVVITIINIVVVVVVVVVKLIYL